MMLLTSFLVFLINIIGLNCQGRNDEKKIEISLAHPYEENFHVVFGMVASTILIVLTFLLISSVSIWTMDPGRDSIIYRMTSQKIKKDL